MKYEMFGDVHYLPTMQRIRALKDFADVKAGDIGGWIEKESNLSHDDDCWVYEDAQVSGDARVYEHARVYGNTVVYGDACVYGYARVFGNAQVSEDAKVSGDAVLSGNSRVFGNAQVSGNARVFGNAWVFGDAQVCGHAKVYGICRSDGYLFCFVPDKDGAMRVMAGCRYFTMREAKVHWKKTRGGTSLGVETMNILDAIELLAKTSSEGCV
jgi:carbonic anhydrase/acetyltransferase-like protein (isoleucine patch superfamily)